MNKLILEQMDNNKLNNHKFEKIAPVIMKLNNYDETEMKKEFGTLIDKGYIIKDDKNKYHTINSFGYEMGKILATSAGYAFCDVEERDEDVYVAYHDLNGAIHGDIVLLKVNENVKGAKAEGKVAKIIEHSIKTVVGKINVFKKFAYVEPDNKKISKDVYIPIKKLKGAKSGDKVYVKLTGFGEKKLEGEILEVLGKENTILSDVLSIVRNYNLIEEFPKEVLLESSKINREVGAKQIENRRDFRNDIIFTIDGDDSKDFDDAVSISFDKNLYTLGVHIADVGHYVKLGSELDKEAFRRATSVYFPNHTLPMLPKELSDDICSLVPHEDRLTLSCIMKITPKGDVQSYEIVESVINSKERMTYGNVTKLLTTENTELHERYNHIMPTLKMMEELCLILEERRKRNGNINFEIPEPKIILDEKQEIIELGTRPRTISERIIESFMVCANETVAKHYALKKFPFVYRVHEVPDNDAVKKFEEFIKPLGLSIKFNDKEVKGKDIQNFLLEIEDHEYKSVINKVLLRCMEKAKYRPECLGHFGLGLEFYSHFTSPIRRYPDLTIHRFIKQDLKGKISKEQLSFMHEFALSSSLQSSSKEVDAEKAERDVDTYYKARFMKKHIGEIYEGIISGVTNHGIYVELDNTAEGFVPVEALPGDNYTFNERQYTLQNNSKKYKLGDKLKIRVDSVNLNERKIQFSLAK